MLMRKGIRSILSASLFFCLGYFALCGYGYMNKKGELFLFTFLKRQL